MNTAMRCVLALLAAGAALAANAADELGPLPEARKRHPAVFVCGNVVPYTVSGKDGYAFAGEAEQSFAGDLAESDAELYQEARLAARGNLVNFIKKKHPDCSVSMSGSLVMYQFPEGKLRRVVCFVEKSSIQISKAGKTDASAAGTSAAKPTEKEASTKTKAVCEVQKGDCRKAKASVPDVGTVLRETESVPVEGVGKVSLDDKIKTLEEKVSRSPSDCLLRCRMARTLAKAGRQSEAAGQYEEIFRIVIADDRCDKTIAAESLMEGAQFFEDVGVKERALKFYRFLIRCNDLRRWKLDREVSVANAKIADLLLN